MDLRALLFGSTLKTAVTVVLALGVTVGGAVVVGVVGVPSVAAMDNDFGPVNETQTTIYTDLVVHNPNPVSVRLGGLTIDYTVSMNGIEMAHGTKEGVKIGTGNSTVNLTTYLANEKIPEWWVSHVKNGENTTLTIDTAIHSGLLGRTVHYSPAPQHISTNVIGQFESNETREVDANTAVVSDPVLYVNRTDARWGDVTQSKTPIEMTFVMYNPKSYPITVSKFGYNITMNDVAMGSGTSEELVTIPPHTAKAVQTTTVIQNQHLDEWWVSHLERDQRTHLTIDFYAVVDAGPAGSIRVPVRGLTYEHLVETHIFEETNATASGGNETTTTTTTTTTSDTTTTTTSTTSGTTTTTADTTTTTTSTTTTTTTTDSGGVLDVAERTAVVVGE
ncbi:LEA type 2 family protein [Halospeciosus flavus]|uniref:LEA type 2 family protein n=1 Tax=Halospeciosus flavus TaxID=3032283 RepID=A0ABD5Z4D0_9EURY|nr:LEA type 2 family protein [Halospeciosus flavus]